MEKRKITPFLIKRTANKEEFNKLMAEYDKVKGIPSFYHFLKYLKDHDLLIVNKQFKDKALKYSVGTVASFSLVGFMMTQVIPKINDEKTEEPPIPETTISDENIPHAVIKESTNVEPTVEVEPTEVVTETSDIVETEETTDYVAKETNSPTMTIYFPKASDTKENSDIQNYNNIKEKYGLYIDKIAEESGVDARIIIAMIAQENPNMKDQTSKGTYGPMCVTSIHDGETLNYGYYDENGNFATKKITIEIDNLKNNNLYENGKYGDITVADAYCILYGVAILKDNEYQISKSVTNLSPAEIAALSIASYNQGYPDVINMTKNYDNLFDAAYAIRYTYASKDTTDDDQYMEHVFNKIPDEELNTPITFVDNNGNLICFNLERNSEISTISSKQITNYTM